MWTLIIITTLKYIILALRMDNEGEGGILALMALLSRKPGRRFMLFIGMFGAALVYGDCALTPAISVLSALEGLHVIAPELDRFVLPGTVAILAALFAVQQRGTALLGRFLGPVMATWFAVLALLGLWGIAQYPAVLWALNPVLGLQFLFRRQADALADHVLQLVEEPVDRLEAQVGHPDEVGVGKRERDAQPSAVRFADVSDFA